LFKKKYRKKRIKKINKKRRRNREVYIRRRSRESFLMLFAKIGKEIKENKKRRNI
jgi:hypothetical protein